MPKKTIIAYGLLLTAATLLLSLALLPEQAYARYDTAIYWNTVVSGAQDPIVTGPETPIFTKDNGTLEFTLPEEIKDPKCSVEVLSADQSYTPIIIEGMTIFQSGNTIRLQMGDVLPPAGTYRLVISWQTEETAEAQTTAVTFFINYSDV